MPRPGFARPGAGCRCCCTRALRAGVAVPGRDGPFGGTGPRSARSVWSRSSRKGASFIAAADYLPGIRSGYRVRIDGVAPPVAA